MTLAGLTEHPHDSGTKIQQNCRTCNIYSETKTKTTKQKIKPNNRIESICGFNEFFISISGNDLCIFQASQWILDRQRLGNGYCRVFYVRCGISILMIGFCCVDVLRAESETGTFRARYSDRNRTNGTIV